MDGVRHFEIPTDDGERAKEFYKKIFGWKIEDMPDMDYTIVRTGKTDEKGMMKEMGVINGGMMKRGMIRSPVITIIVENVDEKLKEINISGGQVIQGSTKVGEIGFSAYFKDTEGNVIGLFQPTGRM